MEFFILIAGAIILLWLMSSRTRKQQQKAAEFRDSLEPGQEVMTGSGLFGTVVAVDDESVTLEIAPGVTSRWLKPAILKAIEPPVEDDEYEDDEYEDDEYEDDDVEYEDDDVEYEDDDVDEDSVEVGALDEEGVEIPDDASSLTEDDDPRS